MALRGEARGVCPPLDSDPDADPRLDRLGMLIVRPRPCGEAVDAQDADSSHIIPIYMTLEVLLSVHQFLLPLAHMHVRGRPRAASHGPRRQPAVAWHLLTPSPDAWE
eukprot:COSAG05_NODE_9767_length_602_cov_1.330020_1_plen_107_part_00